MEGALYDIPHGLPMFIQKISDEKDGDKGPWHIAKYSPDKKAIKCYTLRILYHFIWE